MPDVAKVIERSGETQAMKAAASRWWLDPRPGQAAVEAAKAIEDSASERARRLACLLFARIHSGRMLASIYDYARIMPSAYSADPWALGSRPTLNGIQAVIEAVAAKIAKNKPRPLMLTEGGNWSLQRKAKQLTKFTDGLHRANGVHKTGRTVFRDAGAFGTGIFLPYEDTGRAVVGVDRVLPPELIVDEAEAAAGDPSSCFRKRPVYKQTLLDLMCGKDAPGGTEEKARRRAIIEAAKGENPAGPDGRVSDMLWVYEGWHKNGVHAIGVEEGELFKEDWEFDWLPPTLVQWRPAHTGIWGMGAVENLMGLQREINALLSKVQQAMKKGAVQRTFVKPGAKLIKSKLTTEDGTIIECEEAPTFSPGVTLPTEVFRHIWDLWQKLFEVEGVSQLSATGTKPAGLDAAVAIREFHDVESERFVLLGQEWEDAHLELTRKELALAARMYKNTKTSVVVKAPGTKFIREIDFARVDLRENQYEIGMYPVSMLPATPAGRLQTVSEMYEKGLIADREEALALLDFPDLESTMNLQLAAIDDIKRILEGVLDEETPKYEPPEPFMNLQLALRMAQSAFNRARSENTPDDRQQLLLKFADDTKWMIDQLAPPPAPAQPAAPALAPPPVTAAPPVVPGLESPAVPSALPA